MYEASITKNGIYYYLGTFYTPHEAAKAYDEAAYRFYGINANLNFPEDYS